MQKKAWQIYQEEAAFMFNSAGFSAQIDKTILGARSKHDIDVWVEGDINGIKFSWAIECKCWKTKVPKEKIVAFNTIIQDIGAEKGFALSERGFQIGAINAANKTNISLTSIADLKKIIESSAKEEIIAALSFRRTRLHKKLWRLHKETDLYFSPYSELLGHIFMLDQIIEEGLNNEFPLVFWCAQKETDRKELVATDWDDFILKTTAMLHEAEDRMLQLINRN